MNELCRLIEKTYLFLMKGQIGKANSSWNRALPLLANMLQSQPHKNQAEMIPVMQNILACQERKDWVAMADALKYELYPQIQGK